MPIGFTDNNNNNNHDEQSGYADSQSSSDATQQSSSSQTDIPEFEDLTSTDTNRGSKNNLFFVIIVIILIIVIFIIISVIKKSKNNTNDYTGPDYTETDFISTEATVSDDIEEDTEENTWHDASDTSAYVSLSSESEYVKDLEGESLESKYDVVDTTYFKDFANYEMKRASVDDGMEMYWLEVTYQNKKYRCQIPYYAATNMDISGICVVEIEQLQLANGGTVISYMQVVYDYENMLTSEE